MLSSILLLIYLSRNFDGGVLQNTKEFVDSNFLTVFWPLRLFFLAPRVPNVVANMNEKLGEEKQKQRYTYRVLQTIQMKLILLYVWAEPAILGSTKNAIKFKYEI